VNHSRGLPGCGSRGAAEAGASRGSAVGFFRTLGLFLQFLELGRAIPCQSARVGGRNGFDVAILLRGRLTAQHAEGTGDLALDDGGVLLEPLQGLAARGVGGPVFGKDPAGDLVVLGGFVGRGWGPQNFCQASSICDWAMTHSMRTMRWDSNNWPA
jgi:hypothetical protein